MLVEYDVDALSLAVLFAIKKGLRSPRRIAEALNVDEESIKEVVRELEEKGLIRTEKKKFLFLELQGLKLTREGYNTLLAALERLKPKLEEVKRIAIERGPEEATVFLGALGLGLLAPLLIPMIMGGLLTLPFADLEEQYNNNIYPGGLF